MGRRSGPRRPRREPGSPGGNVTGLLAPLPEWGKFLELARDAVPGATRVAVIGNPTNVVYADYVAQNEAAARNSA